MPRSKLQKNVRVNVFLQKKANMVYDDDNSVEAEKCSFCHQWFPVPVEYHHSWEQCQEWKKDDESTSS